MLLYLFSLVPSLEEEVKRFDTYHLFHLAVRFNNKPVIEWLFSRDPFLIATYLTSDNYRGFTLAAELGNLPFLKWFFSLMPKHCQQIVRANDYTLFIHAVQSGKKAIIRYIFRLAPTEIQHMISAQYYKALSQCARYGHLRVFDFLISQIQHKDAQGMNNALLKSFLASARFGHLMVLKRLLSLIPNDRIQWIKFNQFEGFRMAALHGKLAIVNYIATTFPDLKEQMVAADSYFSFRKSAYFGHFKVCHYLLSLVPHHRHAMYASQEYEVFIKTSVSLKPKLMPFLMSQISEHPLTLQQVCYLFQTATKQGDKASMRYLIELIGYKENLLVSFDNYSIVQMIDTLHQFKFVLSLFPDEKTPLIHAQNYYLFKMATRKSDLEFMKFLVQCSSDSVYNLITDKDLSAVYAACIAPDSEPLRYLAQLTPFTLMEAINNDLLTMILRGATIVPLTFIYLFNFIPPSQIEHYITKNHCELFELAIAQGDILLIKFLYSHVTKALKDNDEWTGFISTAISIERLDVLELLLNLHQSPEFFNLFVNYEQTTLKASQNPIEPEEYRLFTGKSLFLNPLELSFEAKLDLVYSSIMMGYFSIAKSIWTTFFGSNHDYFELLIIMSKRNTDTTYNPELEQLKCFFKSMNTYRLNIY